MKKIVFILLALVCLNCLAQKKEPSVNIMIKDGKHMVVRDNQMFELIDSVLTVKYILGAKQSDDIIKIRENKLGFIDIKVPKGVDIEKYVEELRLSGNFEVVEYNSLGKYSLTPNDTYRTDQWYLQKINVFDVWDITTGSEDIIIAILDSGVDWNHEDIGSSDSYHNIYLNPGEDVWSDTYNPSTGNGIDDDGNGLVDDWKGWNFYNNSNDTRTDYFHGTFVAGIVSAKTNNNKGVAGVAGGNNGVGSKILPFCIGVNAPISSIVDDAIIYAVDKGARVINMSFSCASNSSINSAIQYAANNDVILVAASMNDNTSVDYPASNSNVIAVGATTTSDTRATFSNYGTALDIVAPGEDIYSTKLSNTYGESSGTSFSAPQVSGVAALILSINPLLSNQEVRNIIEKTAQKVRTDLYTYSTVSGRDNGTWNQQMGYGLLDTYAAVSEAKMILSGTSLLCSTGAEYSISSVSSLATVNWDPGMGVERVDADGTNPCTFRATSNGRYSTIGATVTRNGKTVTIPAKTVWIGGPPTPTIIPSGNVTTVMSGYYYTVPRNTYNVFFQMGTHPYVNSSLDDWSYSGVNNMYDYGQFLDMTTYNLGENEVIASQYNSCSTGSSNAYFVVEVVDSRSGSGGEELSFTLSPNPAKEYVDIKVEFSSEEAKLDKLETYQVDFLDAYSRNVKQVELSGASNRVNIQDIPKGYYVVMLRYNGEVYSNKLIVE